MTTGDQLSKKLNQVLSGEPWYGQSVYQIIDDITFESAFEKPGNGSHNIVEILLHLIGWTEEVMDRLNEQSAGTPTSGDWPETGDPEEEKWVRWKNDLKLVNVNLSGVISKFPDDKWNEPIIDDRGTEAIVTYAELVEGAIQHLVYHSAQISLLKRIVSG